MNLDEILQFSLGMYVEGCIPYLIDVIGFAVPVVGSIIVIGVVIKAFKKAVR